MAIAGFLLLVLLATPVLACIYEYGTRDEAIAAAGGHFTYSYNGLDWINAFEGCRGKMQSPILLPTSGAASAALGAPDAKSTFSYGTLSNGTVTNNGHTLQVSLPDSFKSDVQIPIKGDRQTATGTSVLNRNGSVSFVKAMPAQFHFHTTSEHVLSGAEYPMEMHIVHFIKSDQLPACGDKGCPVVLGILLALTDNENEVKPELRTLINAMPQNEGSKASIPGDIDLNALLPTNRSYLTYSGSLTTPPCSEGILWHVLTTPIKISQDLLTKYQEAVGDVYCPDKEEGEKKKKGDDKKDVMPMANGTYFQLPPTDKNGCVKLANGHNWRGIQPVNGRIIKLAT